MAEYQIEATVEKVDLNTEKMIVQIKGCSKYRFEDHKGVVWNIFENIAGQESKIIKLEELFEVKISKNNILVPQIFCHAFLEKKKLKFELDEKLVITGISHVSSQ